MGKRITIEIVSILGISLAAAYAIMLGVVLAFGTALSDAFGEAARFLFGSLVAGIALWTLLVIVLAITLRRRGEGVRIAAHLGAALLAVLLNVALYAAGAAHRRHRRRSGSDPPAGNDRRGGRHRARGSAPAEPNGGGAVSRRGLSAVSAP